MEGSCRRAVMCNEYINGDRPRHGEAFAGKAEVPKLARGGSCTNLPLKLCITPIGPIWIWFHWIQSSRLLVHDPANRTSLARLTRARGCT